MGAAIGLVQGVAYYILPEEDVSRVCQILVDENRQGRVARCWDWPQFFEVASELGKDLKLITGGRLCCQKFAWNPQRFSVDEFGHGRLQVLLKSRTICRGGRGEGHQSIVLAPGTLWRP